MTPAPARRALAFCRSGDCPAVLDAVRSRHPDADSLVHDAVAAVTIPAALEASALVPLVAALDAAHRLAPIAPASLAAAPADDDRIRRFLAARQPVLLEALARIEGRDEWSLRLPAALAAPRPHPPAPQPPEPELSAGVAYLLRRKSHFNAIDARLHATDALRHGPLAPLLELACEARPAEAAQPGELELALLVPRARARELTLRAADLSDRLPALRLTGPWPASSFTRL